MLDYMISLFDDANDFSWNAAKASHAVLLCRMEQGEVKDYSQTEKIDKIRRANAQRHNVTTFSNQNPKKSNPKHMNYVITMLGPVSIVKHTSLGVYCINMCVQPAMQQASLLATQKLNVDPRIKNSQKRMNLGGHTSMTTQRQKRKVYYSQLACFYGIFTLQCSFKIQYFQLYGRY